MHIAFGRVRHKTSPTRVWGKHGITEIFIETLF